MPAHGVSALLALLLSVPAQAGDCAVQSAVCSGNEPFWRLEMGPDGALLSRPGDEEVIEEAFRGAFESLGFLEPPWRIWRGRAVDDPARVLVATMRAETCRDSMSGARFGHRGVVSFPDGAAGTGCCRLPRPDAPSDPDVKP